MTENPNTTRKTPAAKVGPAAVMTALFFVASVGGWEIFWRGEQFRPSVRNSVGLWAMTRARVETEGNSVTTMIGSSRTLFDFNLESWEDETGQVPIQLALEGTSPVPFLSDLANDSAFSSLLVVGVVPPLFFFPGGDFRLEALEHYYSETPAQWLAQRISMPFEKVLAFYHFDTALPTVLKRQTWWPTREGVEFAPRDVRKLVDLRKTRQGDMWLRVDKDTAYAELAQSIWLDIIERPPPPIPPEVARAGLDTLMMTVASHVEAIRSRGGEVVFVRLPSRDRFREIENIATPRVPFWDRLLVETNAVGIHFEDFEELQNVSIPEWSHISSRDTYEFTRHLIDILRNEFEARGIQRAELYR